MKSMKVDFVAKTITITAECAERMNDPNSTEYKAIRQLCADFPSMKIVKRTHRTPRKYVSKSTGEKFNCNQFKNLTYENMETFISGLPNAEQYMTAFNFLKDCGSPAIPPSAVGSSISSPSSAKTRCSTSITRFPSSTLPPISSGQRTRPRKRLRSRTRLPEYSSRTFNSKYKEKKKC